MPRRKGQTGYVAEKQESEEKPAGIGYWFVATILVVSCLLLGGSLVLRAFGIGWGGIRNETGAPTPTRSVAQLWTPTPMPMPTEPPLVAAPPPVDTGAAVAAPRSSGAPAPSGSGSTAPSGSGFNASGASGTTRNPTAVSTPAPTKKPVATTVSPRVATLINPKNLKTNIQNQNIARNTPVPILKPTATPRATLATGAPNIRQQIIDKARTPVPTPAPSGGGGGGGGGGDR